MQAERALPPTGVAANQGRAGVVPWSARPLRASGAGTAFGTGGFAPLGGAWEALARTLLSVIHVFVCLFLILRAKTNALPRLFAREHQLADRIEHHAELRVVLSFEGCQLPGQVRIRMKHLAKTDERAHDLDVHLNRPRAPQHAREHGDAL